MRRVIVAIALMLAATGPARADYPAGVAAYEAGRYEEALAEFTPLVEQGHAESEFMMGVMYFYGKGVAQDPSRAAVWFFKAARQGNATAQLALGSLYIRGTGVSQDLVQAYKWLALAARSDVPTLAQQAIVLRDDTARLLSADSLADAERMATEFEPLRMGLPLSR